MCTIRASCYSAHLSWSLVQTWLSPFIQDKQKVGFGLGKGALPPSITVIVRLKTIGLLDLQSFS